MTKVYFATNRNVRLDRPQNPFGKGIIYESAEGAGVMGEQFT